jgi:hypothetical protein
VWSKIKIISEAFRQYPDAKWLWWLDFDTLIMTPSIELGRCLLNHEVVNTEIWRGVPLSLRYLEAQGGGPAIVYDIPEDIDAVDHSKNFNRARVCSTILPPNELVENRHVLGCHFGLHPTVQTVGDSLGYRHLNPILHEPSLSDLPMTPTRPNFSFLKATFKFRCAVGDMNVM